MDGAVPVLAFKLYSESAFLADLPDENRLFFPYGWCLEFGGALTVTAGASPAVHFKYPPPRVFIQAGADILNYLDAGRFKVVLYRKAEPVAYLDVAFSDEAGGSSEFRQFIYAVRNHKGDLRDCKEALFWQVLEAVKDIYGQFLRPEDSLSIGWQRNYRRLLRCFSSVRDELQCACDFSGYKDAALPKELVEFFDVCLPTKFSANSVCPFAASAYRSEETFKSYLFSREKIESFAGKPASQICDAVFRLGVRDPDVTACGRKVPWVGGGQKGFGFLEPDPRAFPKWFNPEDYWARLPQLPYWALGALVSPSDVPAEIYLAPESWRCFPRAEKPDESVGVADSLLEEALANKRWVIPPRALVQLPLGIFTLFEVSEFANEVFFVGRTERGEFTILELEMGNKALSVPQLDEILNESAGLRSAVYGALKLTLSAVVRDFWVVEERDRVFAQKSAKKFAGVRIHKDDDGASRIVYLPRIRYKDTPTPENCAKSLEHEARAAHFVQAHVRRVGHASDTQIILARRYGFQVPEGYTFVRPHERGKDSRPVIYRSRSALQVCTALMRPFPLARRNGFNLKGMWQQL